MATDVVTFLKNMVDPEVLADMISADLPKAIKFSGIAPVDTTLQGQPGSTITIPRFKYIGEAKEIPEGEEIPLDLLETTTDNATIKKVAKAVGITDESILSGYGDPVNEIRRQLRMSIASTIDNDIVDVAKTAPLSVSSTIGLDLIDRLEETFIEAPDAIEEEGFIQGVLFISYTDAAKLRKEAGVNWTRASDLGDNILVSGAFGEVLGWIIVRSKKIDDGAPIAVKTGAMKTYLKRQFQLEEERKARRRLTEFSADQHYVVTIYDDTKIVRVTAPAG